MRQINTIFLYTLKEGIRKKAFLISTLIIMAVILILSLAPRIVGMFSGEKESNGGEAQITADENKITYFIDKTGLFAGSQEELELVYPDRVFKSVDAGQEKELREEVKNNEDSALVIVEEQNGMPFVRVVNANFMNGINSEKVADVCTSIWQKQVMEQNGMSDEIISQVQKKLPFAEETVGEMDLTGYILGIVMVLVMFFAVYYYGYGVSMSIASEKTSRVMETLVISAKPSRILIGKCLGMGVLGLAQLLAILLFGVLSYTLLVPHNFAISGVTLNFSSFTPATILLVITYFILGYALYAVMNSVCGAAVSKIEDLNSAMMPVTLLTIVGFYLGYFTSVAGGGSSSLSRLAIYLPLSSPFAVPFKLLTGGISSMDLAISIGLLLIGIIVVGTVSIRVYSASVLHYGNKLKMKELLKMH